MVHSLPFGPMSFAGPVMDSQIDAYSCIDLSSYETKRPNFLCCFAEPCLASGTFGACVANLWIAALLVWAQGGLSMERQCCQSLLTHFLGGLTIQVAVTWCWGELRGCVSLCWYLPPVGASSRRCSPVDPLGAGGRPFEFSVLLANVATTYFVFGLGFPLQMNINW